MIVATPGVILKGQHLSATTSQYASASPTPGPPAPHSAAGVLGERRGEALLLGDLMGTLLAHSEELGDLDEPYPR
jgi:hypothetical protein